MALVRGLSRGHLTALAVNCVIGAGILGLPSRAYALAGDYSLLAWIICAVLVTGIALSFAEVSSRFRESGGPYLHAFRAFGPGVGFVVGSTTWLSRVLAFATIMSLVVAYASAITGAPVQGSGRAALMTTTVVGLTVVLIGGIRQTAWASTLLTAGKLALLASLVLIGLLVHGTPPLDFGPPPAPDAFLATVAVLMFAFFGFECVAITAGETPQPERNVPFAIVTSVAIVTLFYVLVQYVSIAGVPGLASSTRPLADLAMQILGPAGSVAIAAGAIVMMGGTMLGVLLGASRMLMAMSEQGQLPNVIAGLHPRLLTPVMAIAISAVAVLIASLLSTFAAAIAMTVTTRLLGYVAVCLALPVLRRTSAEPPAFRVRFGSTVAVGSAVLSASLLATATLTEFATTLVFAVAGWMAWRAYDRTRKRAAGLPASTSSVS
jgi:basic amino acid/polyamine antiporter, APA family